MGVNMSKNGITIVLLRWTIISTHLDYDNSIEYLSVAGKFRHGGHHNALTLLNDFIVGQKIVCQFQAGNSFIRN